MLQNHQAPSCWGDCQKFIVTYFQTTQGVELKYLRYCSIMLHNTLAKFGQIWRGQTGNFKNFGILNME